MLPNGIVVEKRKSSYVFYYKHKCSLHVGIYSSITPQHIHINDFDCKGRGEGKGDGKVLLCESLNYLKNELGLDSNFTWNNKSTREPR